VLILKEAKMSVRSGDGATGANAPYPPPPAANPHDDDDDDVVVPHQGRTTQPSSPVASNNGSTTAKPAVTPARTSSPRPTPVRVDNTSLSLGATAGSATDEAAAMYDWPESPLLPPIRALGTAAHPETAKLSQTVSKLLPVFVALFALASVGAAQVPASARPDIPLSLSIIIVWGTWTAQMLLEILIDISYRIDQANDNEKIEVSHVVRGAGFWCHILAVPAAVVQTVALVQDWPLVSLLLNLVPFFLQLQLVYLWMTHVSRQCTTTQRGCMLLSFLLSMFFFVGHATVAIEYTSSLGGGNLFEGTTYVEAFYFGAITVSTVGYGDFSPQSLSGRLFVAVVVFMVFALQSIITGKVVEEITARKHFERMNAVLRTLSMREKELKDLEGHVNRIAELHETIPSFMNLVAATRTFETRGDACADRLRQYTRKFILTSVQHNKVMAGLESILAKAKIQEGCDYEAGHMLIRRDEVTLSFFLVQEGDVVIIQPTGVRATMAPFTFFHQIGVFARPSQSIAKCRKPCTIIEIHLRHLFRSLTITELDEFFQVMAAITDPIITTANGRLKRSSAMDPSKVGMRAPLASKPYHIFRILMLRTVGVDDDPGKWHELWSAYVCHDFAFRDVPMPNGHRNSVDGFYVGYGVVVSLALVMSFPSIQHFTPEEIEQLLSGATLEQKEYAMALLSLNIAMTAIGLNERLLQTAPPTKKEASVPLDPFSQAFWMEGLSEEAYNDLATSDIRRPMALEVRFSLRNFIFLSIRYYGFGVAASRLVHADVDYNGPGLVFTGAEWNADGEWEVEGAERVRMRRRRPRNPDLWLVKLAPWCAKRLFLTN
jgi:hypothetical protein